MLVFFYIIFFAAYIVALIPVIPDVSSTHADDNVFILVCFLGGLAAMCLPLVFSSNTNHCSISIEGITQKKKYCFGLVTVSSSIPWTGIICWDRSFVCNPLAPRNVPQLRLFFKKGFLRIDEKTKLFSLNDTPTDWERFQGGLVSVLDAVGVSEATPESVAAGLRRMKFAFKIVTVLIAVLLIAHGILSIYTGKLSYSVIFTAAMFVVLFTGIFIQFFIKKSRNSSSKK